MKKWSLVLRAASSLPVLLAGLIWAALEGFLLFSGDWLLYENQALAFIQEGLKWMMAVLALYQGGRGVLWPDRPAAFGGICMFAASAAAAPLMSNGFGLYFCLAAAIFLLCHLPERNERCAG